MLLDDRAIHDTMASMIVHGVFTRHPNCGWPASRTGHTSYTG
ncbi:amidohydrolase domain protein [Mycobacterium xenopi 4042]|uniref:Amidohydrolase domain protein n=1 Tax=Mycobacterium xenopi 4042 TaxID=1299334 RepID=X8E665_MYCXE|nr:amidohydrolase domain protein [Mycobacterium xenopi 4042]